jgi:hypothetical protein
MKNYRIKNDCIKSDRIKSGRIKNDRIKTDRIKRITDPIEQLKPFNKRIELNKDILNGTVPKTEQKRAIENSLENFLKLFCLLKFLADLNVARKYGGTGIPLLPYEHKKNYF